MRILVFCLAFLLFAQPGLAAKKKPVHEAKPAAPKSDTVEAPGTFIKEPNAFHGVKWGTPIDAVKDLTVVEKDGPATYATVKDVTYRIGDAFLTGVVYGFCQDKFAAVMMDYQGKAAYESIRKFLVAKYTEPITTEGNPDSLGWPLGNVLIRMEFDAAKNVGTLGYFYGPLYEPCSKVPAEAKP